MSLFPGLGPGPYCVAAHTPDGGVRQAAVLATVAAPMGRGEMTIYLCTRHMLNQLASYPVVALRHATPWGKR